MTYASRLALLFTLIASCVLAPMVLEAHKPDQSYVYLSIYENAINGRIELNGEDINRILGSNLPDKGFTLTDVEPLVPRIQAYLRDHAGFGTSGKAFPIRFTTTDVLNIDKEEEPDYVLFSYELDGVTDIPETLEVRYDAILEQHDQHRGALIMEHNWKAGIISNYGMFSFIFSPSETTTELDLTDASIWKGFWALVKLGVWHIWIGLDHILFIVALILPAVVWRDPEETGPLGISKWHPVKAFKPAFLYLIKIITFFTIAHSITLALASLNLVNLPSRYVESLIAFSIGLAALHNIRPIFRGREWVIAFVFGLFHGFGFASVLGEKGIGGDYLVWSLLGFNVGVEIGQLLIICAVFPVLYLIRKTFVYPKLLLAGSVLLILIALYWTIERLFEVDIPVFSLFY